MCKSIDMLSTIEKRSSEELSKNGAGIDKYCRKTVRCHLDNIGICSLIYCNLINSFFDEAKGDSCMIFAIKLRNDFMQLPYR